MELIDQHKSILENLYLLSGVVVASLGLFIFRQLQLGKEQLILARNQLSEARKQLSITSKRDSIKLAAEQVSYFANKIIEYSNGLYMALFSAKIEPLKFKSKTFKESDLTSKYSKKAISDYSEKIEPYAIEYLNLLNSLETFATYFVEEVADERVAFKSVGKSFCTRVEQASFVLSVLRDGNSILDYENTISLYNLWNARCESLELKRQKTNLEEDFKTKVEKINEELKEKDQVRVTPIGVEEE